MKRLILGSLMLLVFSCSETKQEETRSFIDKLSKEERTKLFQESMKSAIEKEHLQINGWISRFGSTFKETPTGVFIHEIKKGDTSYQIQSGFIVTIDYTLTLLNGDTVDAYQTQKIKVEFDNNESGLHEALKLLHLNAEAIVVIPSYRAHGLVGDDKSIPSLSTVIYQFKVLGFE
jgi:FKBP-type peptidyl-prolyl cis-trans isomerase